MKNLTDEKQIKEVFQILNLEPNEEFSIVIPGLNSIAIVKNAYISETLHLFDRADGKVKDNYILNLLRGVFTVRKSA